MYMYLMVTFFPVPELFLLFLDICVAGLKLCSMICTSQAVDMKHTYCRLYAK